MTLAERVRVPGTLAVLALGASLAAALATVPVVAQRPTVQWNKRGCTQVLPPTAQVVDQCPAWARAQLHMPSTAILSCVHTTSPEPALLVTAHYFTTEWWLRTAVFSEDGSRTIVPMSDQPSLSPPTLRR